MFLENFFFKVGEFLTPQYGLLENTLLGGATLGMWGQALIYGIIFERSAKSILSFSL